jgi:DHA2 family multidrug resistance protein
VLEHGQQDDWFNNPLITALSTSLFIFGLLFYLETIGTSINCKLKCSDGNLRIGTLMSFILGFGLYGSTLIIPIYTQSILRWTATDAGLLLIPGSITTAIMMPSWVE